MTECIQSKKSFICDMDGVIYHGNKILPGAREFVQWLQSENKKFLFLTNALYDVGYTFNSVNPEYVVVGETRAYNIEKIDAVPADSIIIGDRMDTDIIAGMESGIDTILVLTGISTRDTVNDFAYRPTYVLEGLAQLVRSGDQSPIY